MGFWRSLCPGHEQDYRWPCLQHCMQTLTVSPSAVPWADACFPLRDDTERILFHRETAHHKACGIHTITLSNWAVISGRRHCWVLFKCIAQPQFCHRQQGRQQSCSCPRQGDLQRCSKQIILIDGDSFMTQGNKPQDWVPSSSITFKKIAVKQCRWMNGSTGKGEKSDFLIRGWTVPFLNCCS